MVRRNTSTFWLIPHGGLELPLVARAGLSEERVTCLYDKVGEFCRTDIQDLVCPAPVGVPTKQPPVQPPSGPQPTT